MLLCGCAEVPAEGPETYVVRRDDTLYSIAWRHDLDFRDLARWNGIGADFRISVGQVLVLGPGTRASSVRAAPHTAPRPAPKPAATGPRAPEAPQVSPPRPLPEAAASMQSPPARTPSPARPAAPRDGVPRDALPRDGVPRDAVPSPGASEGASKWVWPTERAGAPRSVPGGGILLSGRLGQDVRAASAGRVVYAGSGLRGYGNLIIIKHADSLLSAYAHNRELLVHDGEEVAAGQVIAHMGESPQRAPVLYFEIRQNGRPVDPLPFLPKTR